MTARRPQVGVAASVAPVSRSVVILGLLSVVAVAAVVLRLNVGGSLASLTDSARDAAMGLRTTRTLSALVTGVALATSGVLLQSLLRNPLASPDLLGMAAGASLGVVAWAYVAYLRTGQVGQVGVGLSAIPAAIGAFAALGVVYLFSQRRGAIDPVTLVLVGVIVSVIAGSLMLLVGTLLPDQGAAAMRASMGSLSDETRRSTTLQLGGVTLAGLGVALWRARAMDAMSLGDDEARSVGVPLGRVQLELFLIAGLMAAIAVVLAGPIGFVGLIAPHLARRFMGPSHLGVVLAAAIVGGTMLTLCDALSKALPVASGTLPIGVIAALVGGPTFLLLLARELSGRN